MEMGPREMVRSNEGKAKLLLEHEDRLDHTSALARVQSAQLLFVGALFGFLGFCFGAFLGYAEVFQHPKRNFQGEFLGDYFPATVSEMVYNTKSACGKCFFAFVLLGGLCMLTSWYPWHLRNVYMGDDLTIPPKSWPILGMDMSGKARGISLMTLRQFLPPLGIMLVACIPAPPAANREFTDTVAAIVHTAGATMSIGGYAFIELFTVSGYAPHVVFNGSKYQKGPKNELTVRRVLIVLCLISVAGFQLFGFLMKQGINSPSADVWKVPQPEDWKNLTEVNETGIKLEDQIAYARNAKLLEKVAEPPFLLIKLGCFWCEVGSGLFMLASHLAIWWFCPERYTDLRETLADPEGFDGLYSFSS